MGGVFSRLGEYETFLGAPAQEIGALQHDLGAVPEGGALLQTSVRQQRIDTEEVSRASLLLGAAGVEYGATQLEALPVQTETALAWSHLSVHAARAADLLLQAQSTMLELTTDAADYAAKLQAAALSYEHAEQIAGALVGVFDSFYSGAVRQIFTSAFTTVRSLPLVLTPQGAAGAAGGLGTMALVGVALVGGFGADAHLRGRRAAASSLLRGGSQGKLEATLHGARGMKQAERAAGIGLGRVTGFREAGRSSGTVQRGGVGGIMARINAAGSTDVRLDAEHGAQEETALGHVDVQVVTRPDGTRAYTVSIPGSDFDNLWAENEPNGTFSALDLASADGTASLAQSPVLMQMVDQALREAGASASDEVLLTGFSQGGMTAQALAANGDFRSRWKVAGVLSMGAPTSAYGGIPDDIPVLSVEDVNDVVPAVLAEDSRPANAQTQEVHVNMGEEEYGIGLFGTHNGAGYEHMAPAVAQQLGRTGEGREYLAMLDRMMPEGAAVSTVTYEAGAEYYNADPDDPRRPIAPVNPASVGTAKEALAAGKELAGEAGKAAVGGLTRMPEIRLPEPCPAPQIPQGGEFPGTIRPPRLPGHPMPSPVLQ